MTRAAIVETLAKEFATDADAIRSVLEMLDAGLTSTYIGRFRRGDTRLTENVVRRIDRQRKALDELDRRRGTILRMLTGRGEKEQSAEEETAFPEIRACMDRFEIEDLFLPHRRPEPEVQLALDRGLGELADRILAPLPKERRGRGKGDEEGASAPAADGAPAPAEASADATPPAGDDAAAAPPETPDAPEVPEAPEASEVPSATDEPAQAPAAEASATEGGAPAAEAVPTAAPAPEAETPGATAPEAAAPEAPASDPEAAVPGAPASEAAPAPDGEAAAPAATSDEAAPAEAVASAEGLGAELPVFKDQVDITPKLALLCGEFVRPDRGVHTEQEALAGAMRVLSDRLGRDPGLRRAVRKAMRKHGVLSVRSTGDESRLQRHRSLLKIKEPIRQLQGRKLLQIRQAQKDRAITTAIALDPKVILPRVQQTLGRRLDPEFEGVVHAVAEQALLRRLFPMIEGDVRLELKERGDEEALRFLAQHLRQILLSPVGGQRAVAGLTINAKQDWILVLVGADGEPASAEIKIETRDKEAMALAEELGNALRGTGVRTVAVGHGKGSLAQVPRIRECIRMLGGEGDVCIVHEAGLTNYANSELARKELADLSVPARMAVSLGRRMQDLLLEVLKVDPRNLGLGMEAGLVSKANLRRTLQETVESAIAYIGCDVNRAPVSILRRLPGLDFETATKIVEYRDNKSIESREELRSSGLLTEAQWVSCVAFLRVSGSPEPLDRTGLHPDQYPLARRLIESTGNTVEDALGQRGATKGLRRADFDVDETVWRDLIREISFPGRDPRLRYFPPNFLPHDTDAATIEKGQIIEGLVSNLTSFGAFIDLGLSREGLIHISEASPRYVRDAREVLSIGQPVRARVLDTGGQRITLSLKNVPPPERKKGGRGGPGRRRERPEGRGGGGGGGRERSDWPEPQRVVRAAQSRRDGLGGSGKSRSEGSKRRKPGGKPGGGPGGGPGRGPGGRRGADRRGQRGEDYDAEAVRNAGKTKVSYNPFANFFDANKDDAKEKEPSGEDS
ncbi:MAG: Tex-like N-terminal domain-containing protein [Planctomycetota bacterium]